MYGRVGQHTEEWRLEFTQCKQEQSRTKEVVHGDLPLIKHVGNLGLMRLRKFPQ